MSEFAFEKDLKKSEKIDEVKKMEEELSTFYKKRRLFLLLGFLALAVGVGLMALGVAFEIPIVYTLGGNAIAGGIALFILRSALFNARIRNRKERIKYLESHPNK